MQTAKIITTKFFTAECNFHFKLFLLKAVMEELMKSTLNVDLLQLQSYFAPAQQERQLTGLKKLAQPHMFIYIRINQQMNPAVVAQLVWAQLSHSVDCTLETDKQWIESPSRNDLSIPQQPKGYITYSYECRAPGLPSGGFMSIVGTEGTTPIWNGPNIGSLAPGVRRRVKKNKKKHCKCKIKIACPFNPSFRMSIHLNQV